MESAFQQNNRSNGNAYRSRNNNASTLSGPNNWATSTAVNTGDDILQQRAQQQDTYADATWLRAAHLEKTRHLQEKAKQHAQQQQDVDISEQTSVVTEVELYGFTGVKRNRVNTRAFFLGRIHDKVNVKQIRDYLLQREILPTLLKVFPSKRKGTISAKLNVKSKDAMSVFLDRTFGQSTCAIERE